MLYRSRYEKWSPLTALPLILLILGIAFNFWSSGRRAARWQALSATQRPFTVDQLSGVAEGTEVVTTGWIAYLNSPQSRQMVFYDTEVRQTHHNRRTDQTWEEWDEDSSQDYHPSFLLRQYQGTLTILGGDYSLEGWPDETGTPGFETSDPPVGARRYRGCYPGRLVSIIGRVTRSGSPGVRAELVFSGTPDQLASFEKQSEGESQDIAAVMFAIGMVCLVFLLMVTIPFLLVGRGNSGIDQESALNGRPMSVWPR